MLELCQAGHALATYYNSNLFLCAGLCVTHRAVWRSDGCSPLPVSSCNLQETHTKHHQMCERGAVQTDCISRSCLLQKLDAQNAAVYGEKVGLELTSQHITHSYELYNTSFCRCQQKFDPKKVDYTNSLLDTEYKCTPSWCNTCLSDAGESKVHANIHAHTPVTHTNMLSVNNIIYHHHKRYHPSSNSSHSAVWECLAYSVNLVLPLPPWLQKQLIHRVGQRTQNKIQTGEG